MTFKRKKVVNGKAYWSLEERYREGGKVRSRYIKSLTGFDRSIDGHSSEVQDMQQGYEQLQSRDKAAEAPAADSGKENAASENESGDDSGPA